MNCVHIRSSLSMRLTSASPHDVCQTQQNDLPSFPSLIGRRRRWRFPATIIKMNHSTRDSGGSVGSGEEQGTEEGKEAQVICQRQCGASPLAAHSLCALHSESC